MWMKSPPAESIMWFQISAALHVKCNNLDSILAFCALLQGIKPNLKYHLLSGNRSLPMDLFISFCLTKRDLLTKGN